MAETFEIPLDSQNASFKIRTVLEGIEVVLRFDWSTREQKWLFSVYNASEIPFFVCHPLNVNLEMFNRFEFRDFPAGSLVLVDTSEKNLECGRNDLGDRCKLVYRTSV